MFKMNLQLFAHKKGVGSTKNGRDSESKRLGAKRADGQLDVYKRQEYGIPGPGRRTGAFGDPWRSCFQDGRCGFLPVWNEAWEKRTVICNVSIYAEGHRPGRHRRGPSFYGSCLRRYRSYGRRACHCPYCAPGGVCDGSVVSEASEQVMTVFHIRRCGSR